MKEGKELVFTSIEELEKYIKDTADEKHIISVTVANAEGNKEKERAENG